MIHYFHPSSNFCPRPYAPCPLPYTPRPMPFALCLSLPHPKSVLCPLFSAPYPMPHALSSLFRLPNSEFPLQNSVLRPLSSDLRLLISVIYLLSSAFWRLISIPVERHLKSLFQGKIIFKIENGLGQFHTCNGMQNISASCWFISRCQL